jgi:hypothetical protein
LCTRREKAKGGKKTWIDYENNFISEELLEESQRVLEKARRGERSTVIWMDFAKDETRPIEKVDSLKTRSVNCSPLVFTLVCRQVYGAFCAMMVDGKIFNGSAIGVNPYAFEWTDLSLHLKEVGDNMIAGDFGNWDGGLSSELMWSGFDVIEHWYRQGEDYPPTQSQMMDRVARRTVFEDIVHSCHIVGSDIYQWSHSMPSGTYLTAFLNTIINWILFCYFCLSRGMKASEFLSDVRGTALGDDHIYSVSHRFPHLDQTLFKSFVEGCGMRYTDESKSDTQHRFRNLSQVEFLKRKFVWDSDSSRWLAPLSYDSIAEMMNWVRTSLPLNVAMKLNYNCAVRELTLHGSDVFERSVAKLTRAFREIGIVPDYTPPFSILFSEVIDGSRWPYDP